MGAEEQPQPGGRDLDDSSGGQDNEDSGVAGCLLDGCLELSVLTAAVAFVLAWLF